MKILAALCVVVLLAAVFVLAANRHRQLAQTEADHHTQTLAEIDNVTNALQTESERTDGIERRLVELHAEILKLGTKPTPKPAEKPRQTPVFDRGHSANR